MAVEALIANKIGMLSDKELSEHNKLIAKIGLPTNIPNINTVTLINELKKDSKNKMNYSICVVRKY